MSQAIDEGIAFVAQADNCLTIYKGAQSVVFEVWAWDGQQKGELISRTFMEPGLAAKMADDLAQIASEFWN